MITVALIGIGGYGNSYVSTLLDEPRRDEFRLVAAADPSPTSCRRLTELEAEQVPIYRSTQSLFEQHRPDLVILATPLHLHARQTCEALAHGCHVLCEKPLCVSPAEVDQMARARDAAGKLVAVGYQWSFSDAIQRFKADVLAGTLGAPRRMRCMVLWPRDEAYYRRNRWAGAKRDAHGNLVLDSPVNNACAHYLHNLLYLLGPSVDRSATPERLTAELYRAHPIENYDTAAIRCHAAGGAEILFVVSHATGERKGPVFCCEFDQAAVHFSDAPGATIVARFADGSTRDYGSPNEQRSAKIWKTMAAIRRGEPTVCGIEAAEAHVRCAWAAQQSTIFDFPASLARRDADAGRIWIEGLNETLERCYERAQLPTELGVPWARRGQEVVVEPARAVKSE